MTDDEVQTLARLLRKVAEERLGLPRLPREVFAAMRGVVTMPTVELLITQDGRDVLLTPRHDQHWAGHHLPGGFVGVEEGLDEACLRVARAELGVSARLVRLVGHYSWAGTHPYATPLSLLCLCELDAPPREGEFFSELPKGLIPQHRELLERWWPEPAGRPR